MFGFDPAYIERAPIASILYWHGRAVRFAQARAEPGARQAELDQAIAAAIKGKR